MTPHWTHTGWSSECDYGERIYPVLLLCKETEVAYKVLMPSAASDSYWYQAKKPEITGSQPVGHNSLLRDISDILPITYLHYDS